eukprot:107922-Prorocentrum_minimum.AAC.2
MADYLMFDIVAVLALSYAMTVSAPLPQLGPARPTARLFSATTVARYQQRLVRVREYTRTSCV